MATPTLKFEQAIAVARSADDVWRALERLTQEQVGAPLFTIMTVDMKTELAQRVYTSHPKEYPVSGTKPIHRDAWFDIVHGEKQSFVANTIADIAKVFPDYELIASLGCGSVLNLPIVIRGELVATVNMLAEEHHYTPERVKLAEDQLKVPASLCWALSQLFDRDEKTPD